MIEVYLQPGEYAVGDASYRIRTLLGSCVSITLWHREQRVGAMSHFLLATRSPAEPEAFDARYGDEALLLMVRELSARRVNVAECEAKLFGGADMFPEQSTGSKPTVGRVNGEVARELVRALGLRVVSHSLYGFGHREVIFNVATGDVWARQRKPSAPWVPEGRKA
jgi:chemotaxis protein CheD